MDQANVGGIREDSEYFRCTKLNCSLSRAVCGQRFAIAKNLLPNKSGLSKEQMLYSPCRGCDTGSKHHVVFLRKK